MKGASPVGWFAGALQALGAAAVAVGLFATCTWPVAVLVLGVLAVAGGTVLEIGKRPRAVLGAVPLSESERRVRSLADRAQHASGR